MVSRHGLTIASLILGVLGSLYLSYDLFGGRGGLLRRLFAGSTAAIIGGVTGLLAVRLGEATGLDLSNILGIPFPIAWAAAMVVFAVFWLPSEQWSPLSVIGYSEIPKQLLASIRRGWFWRLTVCVALLAPIVADKLKAHDITGALVVTAGDIIFLVICFFTNVAVYAVMKWASSTSDRRLGSIGAFLTLLAFAVQLALELTTWRGMFSREPGRYGAGLE